MMILLPYDQIEDYDQRNQESSMVSKEFTKGAHGIGSNQLLSTRQPKFFSSECGGDHEDCGGG